MAPPPSSSLSRMSRQLEATPSPSTPPDLVGAAASPVPSSREIEVIIVPPGGMFDTPAPEPVKPAKSDPKAKPEKARPEKARPEKAKPEKARPKQDDPAPTPDAPDAPPRQRRTMLWLILLMVALGVGAMAAAYYWPADL
jgi:hypothetical protein